ncbi:MAG: protein kinase [archaeon]|nr:protein kinase [archaeon]
MLPRRPLERCRDYATEFVVEEQICSGSYGTVYRARDKTSGRLVALKALHFTEGYGGFPYFMLREILFLLRLDHPNIIRGLLPAMQPKEEGHGFQFYVVMEFVAWDLSRVLYFHQHQPSQQSSQQSSQPSQQLLSQQLSSQHFSLGMIKSILLQLLAAVQYLHQLNLLHRDLKPSNILLTAEGCLKVADLGSVRDADRKTLTLTADVTTMAYRSPELLLQSPVYTSSVDIWSIGCIFYELLAYRVLFNASNEPRTLVAIIDTKGSPPSDVWDRCFSSLPGLDHPQPLILAALDANPLPKDICEPSLADSPLGSELLEHMLKWDPAARISVESALAHPFFLQDPAPQTALPPL